VTRIERELLDGLRAAHNDVLYALGYCENGIMPADGVNCLRRTLADIKETMDRYPKPIKGDQ
jgi:hypothetical protein